MKKQHKKQKTMLPWLIALLGAISSAVSCYSLFRSIAIYKLLILECGPEFGLDLQPERCSESAELFYKSAAFGTIALICWIFLVVRAWLRFRPKTHRISS